MMSVLITILIKLRSSSGITALIALELSFHVNMLDLSYEIYGWEGGVLLMIFLLKLEPCHTCTCKPELLYSLAISMSILDILYPEFFFIIFFCISCACSSAVYSILK